MDEPHDVLIVGGGVLGCAAAVTFARQGRKVLLLERDLREPDRVVGELLQPDGVAALERLGMGECLEGIDARPVKGYEIFYRGENITFWYPPVEVKNDSIRSGGANEKNNRGLKGRASPVMKRRPEGRSFHHGKFVMKLRDAAKREEGVQVVQTTVKSLIKCEKSEQVIGAVCSTKGDHEQRYFADLTIVADGQASNFRSQYTEKKPVAKSRFWSLELIDAELPSHDLAYGVIGSGPPILIYQIGTHETRILIDIPNNVYEDASKVGNIVHYVQTQVVPDLPASVRPSVTTALRDGRLRSMPNSWLPPSMNVTRGIALLGDAMNMRHPLTGGGMTVALNDVVLLSQLLAPRTIASFKDTRAVLQQMRRFHWQRKEFSTSLNILAQALYSLFVADDPQLQVLQRGFIRYIKLGGNCVEEPAGLMGGVIHSPWLLLYHFFAVALYSLWILLHESYASSVFHVFPASLECLHVFAKAVGVILPFMLSELGA